MSRLGSTVSLHYLSCLRDIGRIKNYDWGGMAYATLLHFMTQLSWSSHSSLGDAPFAWQVRFWILGYVCILESHFGFCIIDDVCWFFLRSRCTSILGWSSSFRKCWWYVSQVSSLAIQVLFVNAFQAIFASLAMVIDNLTVDNVSFSFLFFLCVGFCVWLWFGFLSFWVLCNF